jgi:hypothetical protein
MGFDTEMSRQTLNYILLGAALLFLALAVATVVPYPSLVISDLGYHTFCPFAPWSTLILLLLAGLSWLFRRHVQGQG